MIHFVVKKKGDFHTHFPQLYVSIDHGVVNFKYWTGPEESVDIPISLKDFNDLSTLLKVAHDQTVLISDIEEVTQVQR